MDLKRATLTTTGGTARDWARMGTTSMEKVLNNRDLVSIIMSKLKSGTDWYAASMISKGWHDGVIQQASKLVVRSSSSLPHIVKVFKHIRVLDLGSVSEELEDKDLELCAESFENLCSLTIGQESCPSKITNAGILTLAAKRRFLEHLKFVNIPGLEDSGLRALATKCPHLKSLALESCCSLTDAAISAICAFPALVELELFGTDEWGYDLFTEPALNRIGTECPNLLKLRLPDGIGSMDELLESVAKGCPKLQEVSIGDVGGSLKSLVDCKSLTSLSGRLDDEVLPICRANKNLKELLFTDNRAMPLNDVVTEIMQGLQLETFYMAAVHFLFPPALRCMASCCTLRHLTLEDIQTNCLEDFGQFSAGLQSLALRNCDGLKSMQLKSIVSLNRDLRLLNLSGCNSVGIRGFSAIAQCKHLQVLDLSSTKVNDGGLVAIAKGVQVLTKLNLRMCTNIQNVKTTLCFTTLETLGVQGCRFVSDHWLELLPRRCPRLLHLDVSRTNVTDEGIIHLCRCSLLRTLNAGFCQFVNGPGLVRVAKSCLFFEQVTVNYALDKSRVVELKEQVCRVLVD